MNIDRLEITRACNLDCRFCQRHGGLQEPLVPPAELKNRIEQFAAHDCRLLIITGGEPTLHPDLPELVSYAKKHAIEEVSLETNAIRLAELSLVVALKDASLDVIIAQIPTQHAKVWELMTGNKHLFPQVFEGLRNLDKAGLPYYLNIVLSRWNIGTLEGFIDYAQKNYASMKGILFQVLNPQEVRPTCRQIFAPISAIGKAVTRAFAQCRRLGLEFSFADRSALPPCADPELARYKQVFSERERFLKQQNTETHKLPICRTCLLDKQCSGIEENLRPIADSHNLKPLNPIPDRSLRTRCAYGRFREKDTSAYVEAGTHGTVPETANQLLWITNQCNMDCGFCWVDLQLPHTPLGDVLKRLKATADAGFISITGGEPTLHPDILDIVGAASAMAFELIELQTNGMRCADESFVQKLAERGLRQAFVSLHGSKPEIADRCTNLPGGFLKTVKGIHNLLKNGIIVKVNFVINRLNMNDLVDFARFLRQEFSDEGRFAWNISFAQFITDYVDQSIVPRYADVRQHLKEALDFCLEHNLDFCGLEGECGIPPCVLNGDQRYFRQTDQRWVSDTYRELFTKVSACHTCTWSHKCIGVRKSYVEHYGQEEFGIITGF